MSIYKDYIENYYQTIQKYKDSINLQVIEQSINTVADFVRNADSAPTELLNFHDKSKIFGEESYKYDAFSKAHAALCLDAWDKSLIGSGSICGYVAAAMAHTDNLGNRRSRDFWICLRRQTSKKEISMKPHSMRYILETMRRKHLMMPSVVLVQSIH